MIRVTQSSGGSWVVEKSFKLKTSNKYRIYGTLNYKNKKPTKVIIFIHGLTGHPNEQIFYNGKEFFCDRSYATIRFALYSEETDARRLDQTTLKTQAKDLDRVVSYARKTGFKKIFLVGHSLGGPTILLSDTSKVNAISLWDPSYNLKKLVLNNATFNKKLNTYVINWGVRHIWSRKMCEELMNYDNCDHLIQSVNTPIQILAAGAGELVGAAKSYYAAANKPKKLVVIPKAGHCFNEEGVAEKLFLQTYKWLTLY